MRAAVSTGSGISDEVTFHKEKTRRVPDNLVKSYSENLIIFSIYENSHSDGE